MPGASTRAAGAAGAAGAAPCHWPARSTSFHFSSNAGGARKGAESRGPLPAHVVPRGARVRDRRPRGRAGLRGGRGGGGGEGPRGARGGAPRHEHVDEAARVVERLDARLLHGVDAAGQRGVAPALEGVAGRGEEVGEPARLVEPVVHRDDEGDLGERLGEAERARRVVDGVRAGHDERLDPARAHVRDERLQRRRPAVGGLGAGPVLQQARRERVEAQVEEQDGRLEREAGGRLAGRASRHHHGPAAGGDELVRQGGERRRASRP